MEWSGWRAMWVMVMFDLPTLTKRDRKEANLFRKRLIQDGFLRMQLSIYMRPVESEERAKVHDRRVRKIIPPKGEVRILHITDAQFGRMKIFEGKTRKEPEQRCQQIELF